MAYPYKLTIPQSKGELEDLLGWMVLSCPDFSRDWPGANIDPAFEELQLGIERVVEQEPKRATLLRMAQQVRTQCEAKCLKDAIQVLDAMSELLRRKAVH